MGTHPIFESDFDCLTDRLTDSQTVAMGIDLRHNKGKYQRRPHRSAPVSQDVYLGLSRQGLPLFGPTNRCYLQQGHPQATVYVPNQPTSTFSCSTCPKDEGR